MRLVRRLEENRGKNKREGFDVCGHIRPQSEHGTDSASRCERVLQGFSPKAKIKDYDVKGEQVVSSQRDVALRDQDLMEQIAPHRLLGQAKKLVFHTLWSLLSSEECRKRTILRPTRDFVSQPREFLRSDVSLQSSVSVSAYHTVGRSLQQKSCTYPFPASMRSKTGYCDSWERVCSCVCSRVGSRTSCQASPKTGVERKAPTHQIDIRTQRLLIIEIFHNLLRSVEKISRSQLPFPVSERAIVTVAPPVRRKLPAGDLRQVGQEFGGGGKAVCWTRFPSVK